LSRTQIFTVDTLPSISRANNISRTAFFHSDFFRILTLSKIIQMPKSKKKWESPNIRRIKIKQDTGTFPKPQEWEKKS
jgi:hypothetical protein